ncbi:MAG: phosphodiesterase [Ruminococcaceae bacterium]|nr:phosphodiesterase [Oscillospiraceae bacterium]
MKWFIASDIHGSAYFCEKLIERYKAEKADKILLLGDILYHGPRNDLPRGYNPKAVIGLLNELKNDILCVRGNCDTEVDQMVLHFPILADYCIITHETKVIYATHGHIFNKEHLPPLNKGDILLHGHTHIPVCEQYDNFTYINPGSVSIPKENSHHGYMIFEDGVFYWRDLDGNVINEYKI